jgi:hypothetical protein
VFAPATPRLRHRRLSAGALLLALVFLPIQPLLGDTGDVRSAVERAVLSMDETRQDERWHFTMTMIEESEEKIVRHNPLQEPLQQRTLVSVEGKAPNKSQLKDFRKREAQRIEDRDPEANFSYLVDLETLQQTSVSNHLAEVSFSPRIKQLEDFRENFAGKLILNTASNTIDRIEISSNSAFSPAFSVTLEHYRLSFSFRDEQGARLLHSMVSVASGKAGFFKRFETETRVSFGEYAPATKAAATIE